MLTTSEVSVVRYWLRLILTFLTKKQKNKKKMKNDQTGTQAIYLPVKFQADTSYSFCIMLWAEYS